MDKCAWCEELIDETQSFVLCRDGVAYHMDPCRVLVLERENRRLHQQLANVRHCAGCGGDWYDGGLNAPECPWCKLATAEETLKKQSRAHHEEVQDVTAKTEAEIRAAFEAGWGYGYRYGSFCYPIDIEPGDELPPKRASEAFTAYQRSRQPGQGETR